MSGKKRTGGKHGKIKQVAFVVRCGDNTQGHTPFEVQPRMLKEASNGFKAGTVLFSMSLGNPESCRDCFGASAFAPDGRDLGIYSGGITGHGSMKDSSLMFALRDLRRDETAQNRVLPKRVARGICARAKLPLSSVSLVFPVE